MKADKNLNKVEKTQKSSQVKVNPTTEHVIPLAHVPATTVKQKNFVLDFFNPQHVLESFKVLSKERPGNQTKLLILVILCNTFFFATIGEEGLYILFTRTALNWTIEFSYFITFVTATGLIGMFKI